MKESDKVCPVRGCCGPAVSGRVVCRDCWRLLPQEMRMAVWTAWGDGDWPAFRAAAKVALDWFKERVTVVREAP